LDGKAERTKLYHCGNRYSNYVWVSVAK
jgi:hypothetical protein